MLTLNCKISGQFKILFFSFVTAICPLYSQGQATENGWHKIVSPEIGVKELLTLGTILLARSDSAIYQSNDHGSSWTKAILATSQPLIRDLEVTGNIVYAAISDRLTGSSHIAISNDQGVSFEKFYGTIIDPINSVDFEANYGWFTVKNWGNVRGPNKLNLEGIRTAANGDLPYEYLGELTKIVADKLEPNNVAYANGFRGDLGGFRAFRTLNGGNNWLTMERLVVYSTILHGEPIVLSNSYYSSDRGANWNSLPFSINTAEVTTDGKLLFLAQSGGGIHCGPSLDQLSNIGLGSLEAISLAANEDYVFSLTEGEENEIFVYSLNGEENDVLDIAYGATVADNISHFGQVKRYRFPARVGDVITLRLKAAINLDPELSLIGPSGNILAKHSGLPESFLRIDTTLLVSGNYTIMIRDIAADIGIDQFGFSLRKLAPWDSVDIKPDTLICPVITQLGQNFQYNFQTSPGDQITIKVDIIGYVDPLIEIYNPAGSLSYTYPLDGPPSGPFRSNLTLSTGGIYSLLVTDRNEAIYDLSDLIIISIQKKNNGDMLPEIRGDTIISATFPKLDMLHSYTFLGRDQDTILIEIEESITFNARIEVYDPDGERIAQASPFGHFILDTTGIHTLLICGEAVLAPVINPFDQNYILQVSGVGRPVIITKEKELCANEIFEFEGRTFDIKNPNGVVAETSVNLMAPDTIYHVNLSFFPIFSRMVTDTFCLGQDTTIAGALFNQFYSKDTLILERAAANGCDSVIYVDISYDITCSFISISEELSVPKVFTPNGDGLNDQFIIPLLQKNPSRFVNSRLVIFTREKRKVFESWNYHNDGELWEGRDMYSGRPLSVGTYYYFFELGGEEKIVKNGSITIIR